MMLLMPLLRAGAMHVLISLIVSCLSLVPPFLGALPGLAWLLTWAWATALYFDEALQQLTPSQRRAVSHVLVTAQPDDPLLVICRWDTTNVAGAWHKHRWAPEGVESRVVSRLQGLRAIQSRIDPNVLFWRKVVGQ